LEFLAQNTDLSENMVLHNFVYEIFDHEELIETIIKLYQYDAAKAALQNRPKTNRTRSKLNDEIWFESIGTKLEPNQKRTDS
jgi:hypothetical protein